MATRHHPILDRPGLDPGPAHAPDQRRLDRQLPTWGYEFANHTSQQRAEEQATGRPCPICDPDAA